MRKGFIAILMIGVVVVTLHAASGDLDTSFSADGKVATNLGGMDIAVDVAVQPDGRIVAVGSSSGNVAVVRYTAGGALDTSFSGDGAVITDVGGVDSASAVALQPDGRIVVAGTTGPASFSRDVAILRYNSDGTLDTTFDGDGIRTINFADAGAADVALQADGKIVAVGSDQGSVVVVRLSSNGTLDGAFGGDGIVTAGFGAADAFAAAVAIQANGAIVVAGSIRRPGNALDDDVGDFLVVRFDATGLQDAGFGAGFTNGAPVTNLGGSSDGFDTGRAIAIQPDGKIVVVGQITITFGSSQLPQGANSAMGVVRYNPNGSLDATFAGDGIRSISFETLIAGDEDARSVAVLPDGGIAVGGSAGLGTLDSVFALARLTSAGLLETSFSGDGLLTTSIGTSGDVSDAMAVQTLDGRIVLAGTTFVRNSSNSITDRNLALARYHTYACQGVNATRVGTQGGDTLFGRFILGRSFTTFELPDVILGFGGSDSIDGRGNDDIICGGSGNDTLAGGSGNDTLVAGTGADTLNGGSGTDACFGLFQLTPTFDPADSFSSCESVFTGGSGFSGEWLDVGQRCNRSGPNPQCLVEGLLSIVNPGVESTGTEAFIALYLSSDEHLDEADALFATVKIGPLQSGEQEILRISERLSGVADLTGRFLIAVLDSTNVVPEVNEANNVIVSKPMVPR